MSKKVKCRECERSMSWAVPQSVGDVNISYAEHCLDMARRTLCCDWTMRTKPKGHEQYCKHYLKKAERDIERDEKFDATRLDELEQKISEYWDRKRGNADGQEHTE